LEQLQKSLPPKTVAVAFSVSEGLLTRRLISPEGVETLGRRINWATTEHAIEMMRRSLSGKGTLATRILLSILYDGLVSDWIGGIARGTRIFFLPTGALGEVPFCALINRSSGKYLLEDYPSAVAPGPLELIAALQRDTALHEKSLGSALIVGDPSLSSRYPLPRLPGAAEEAESLGSVYRGLDTRLLLHRSATPARVLSELGDADVVHLASHAIADTRNPSLSVIFLSPDGSDSGILFATDIALYPLDHTRLVVLDSCRSLEGIGRAGGMLGLAQSFLFAGVPAVVGNLWDVNDESPARLFVRFHQEIRRGTDALEALRIAQLEAKRSLVDENDWTWAGYEVLGGVIPRDPVRLIIGSASQVRDQQLSASLAAGRRLTPGREPAE